MPVPPKPIDPGHRIDPSRNGDGHAIQPPASRNGKPLPQKPETDGHGRFIPPGSKDIGIIGDKHMIGRINGVQAHWNTKNHGYGWYNWNGHLVGHHYDQFGYHWWGFYVGNAYFWTRYFDSMYWWYDPYWHRWCWLNNDSWWWQNDNGIVYIVINGQYYQYQDDNGTVVVVPDQTPPVDVPPGPSDQTPASYYSVDGTRYVTIDPTDGSAYLYDATVTDASDPRAQGRFLGSSVSAAQFVYDDATASDGTQTQVLRQITLTFTDGITTAAVDPNGEREVQLASNAAVLYNLDDTTVAPMTLSQEASTVQLIDQPGQDSAGESEQVLQEIVINQQDGTSAAFDRDGNPSDGTLQQPLPSPTALQQPAGQAQAAQQRVLNSDAFKALQSGSLGW